jgi:hypothetical protein
LVLAAGLRLVGVRARARLQPLPGLKAVSELLGSLPVFGVAGDATHYRQIGS